jgi:acetate kinase
LKFDLLEVGPGESSISSVRLAHGVVDRIGSEEATFALDGRDHVDKVVGALTYGQAVAEALGALRSLSMGEIEAVGHRVVHGGDHFVAPTLLDDAVVVALADLSDLAPLHNPPAVEVIHAARDALGHVPMVAVFDTAFHSTLPTVARTYALPHDLASRHGIRRYGFHGIAHQYMVERYCALSGTPAENARIITLQLGNGCSACAIRGGKPVDTSMGFTPLEGLVMGTRSGDLDPGIVGWLAAREGAAAGEVVTWLNKRSGLLGISGIAGDMRTLLDVRESEPMADLAIEVFSYRVRKYIGAYMAVLGGADAIIFGGGIGEHAPYVRGRILDNMGWCGLRLDPARNERATEGEMKISGDDSQVSVYVVSVDEALLIARQTYECIMKEKRA